MINKQGRVVLVTGAAGGIGRAICEIFTDEGYRVIGVDCRNPSNLQCEFVNFDITRVHLHGDECDSFHKRIGKLSGGRLDALVNNAAIQIIKPIEEISTKDWDETLRTNLLAPFWMIQRLLPVIRKVYGSIVNIASIHATLTKSEFSMYATSKAALVALTQSLAIELAPEVRVNAVIPAATDTSMLRAGFGDKAEGLQILGDYHPLGRVAQPEEIAQVALFLASPQASFVTGAAVNVDGGIGVCLHDTGNN